MRSIIVILIVLVLASAYVDHLDHTKPVVVDYGHQ